MNSFLFLFFTLLSADVLASKARLQALGNSLHLIDSQTIYKSPIDLIELDNLVVLESGLTAASSVTNGAEAFSAYRFKEKQSLALSMGHQDEAVADARNFINILNSASFELPQNPLHIFYSYEDSITSYAVGFFYSAKSDKVLDLDEHSNGLSAGVEMGNLQISSLYTFTNSAEAAADKKFDGSGYWQTTLSYLLENTTIELKYINSKAKMSTVAGAVTTEDELHMKNVISLGLADTTVRDGNDFFWGGQLVSTTINCKINLSADCNKAFTQTILPAWFGIEAPVTDWMIFRGSVKQSFIVSITKDEFGYPATIVNGATGTISNFSSAANDTVITSGLGFKFKDLLVDGTLSSATTQKLDLDNMISQVALTFKF